MKLQLCLPGWACTTSGSEAPFCSEVSWVWARTVRTPAPAFSPQHSSASPASPPPQWSPCLPSVPADSRRYRIIPQDGRTDMWRFHSDRLPVLFCIVSSPPSSWFLRFLFLHNTRHPQWATSSWGGHLPHPTPTKRTDWKYELLTHLHVQCFSLKARLYFWGSYCSILSHSCSMGLGIVSSRHHVGSYVLLCTSSVEGSYVLLSLVHNYGWIVMCG